VNTGYARLSKELFACKCTSVMVERPLGHWLGTAQMPMPDIARFLSAHTSTDNGNKVCLFYLVCHASTLLAAWQPLQKSTEIFSAVKKVSDSSLDICQRQWILQ
jgi:hypothetical protein